MAWRDRDRGGNVFLLDPAQRRAEVACELFAVLDLLELIGRAPYDAGGNAEAPQGARDRLRVGIIERLHLPHDRAGSVMHLVMRPVRSESLLGLLGRGVPAAEEEVQELAEGRHRMWRATAPVAAVAETLGIGQLS
jgi:hypothetical protein